MAKIMQNLVVLMNEIDIHWDISCKAGKMCFNRFCIDEDAAFELSGVWYTKRASILKEDSKGKGYPMSTTTAYNKLHWSVLLALINSRLHLVIPIQSFY